MIKVIDNLIDKVKANAGITLDEGFEILRRKKANLKETRTLQDEKVFRTESEVFVPGQEQQRRYLRYALSLIQYEHPLYWHILTLRMQEGYSGPKGLKKIAKTLSQRLNSDITVACVSRKEAEAIRCVQHKIDRLKQRGIPIFSEPPTVLAN